MTTKLFKVGDTVALPGGYRGHVVHVGKGEFTGNYLVGAERRPAVHSEMILVVPAD